MRVRAALRSGVLITLAGACDEHPVSKAAKRTDMLIPLCHSLGLDSVEVRFTHLPPDLLRIDSTVRTTGRTGVEMEALVAVSTSALTVYDMCKAVDRDMTIEQIRLESKSGGRSGDFLRDS